MSDFLDNLVAIDMHTHATRSTRNAPDQVAIAMDAAMDAYFKQPLRARRSTRRPPITESAGCWP